MELKAGFKQTEVGMIPEDWDAVPLAQITSHIGDGLHGTPIYSPTGAYFFINGNNLVDGKIVSTSDTKSVDVSEYIKHKKPLVSNSILMSINGTVGNLALFDGEPVILGKSTAYLNVKLNFSKLLVYYSLQTELVDRQFFDGLTGSTIGNLGLTTIRQTQIPIPSTRAEQEAIAEALRDADALVESLDQLITKKRNLKQAAMQQLLTGQTRLPGFSGEWEVKRLADVFTISAGKTKSAYVETGGRYWVVDMGSVSTDGKLIVSKSTNFHGDFLAAGDLVMPKDDIGGGGIIGRVGYIDADMAYVLGDHVYRLTAIGGNSLFLSYAINGHKINSALRKKVIGSAQLGLGRKSVEDQEIPFPTCEEQTAIATILSDMDTELAELESRLAKARHIKQGMMQELLTGRIRLL
jgi:type I restriction enzyme S subunit